MTRASMSLWHWIAVAVLAWSVSFMPTNVLAAPKSPLTVMTFNIRLGTAEDGENHWLKRRDMLFALLRTQNPDLIGLQEAIDFQIHEIVAALPGYAVVGIGRDDGVTKGEFSAILFRTARFRVAEAGTFWFSDTPTIPGSMTWGNHYPRISSWARFLDHDGGSFYHFNLHLDHESQVSRERSVTQLLERVSGRNTPRDPVIITGDFNVGEDNPAVLAMTRPTNNVVFLDSFRVLHPDTKDVGTFTDFKFDGYGSEKIDYVFVQPKVIVERAEILRYSERCHYPSDHFPVIARIRFP